MNFFFYYSNIMISVQKESIMLIIWITIFLKSPIHFIIWKHRLCSQISQHYRKHDSLFFKKFKGVILNNKLDNFMEFSDNRNASLSNFMGRNNIAFENGFKLWLKW